MKLENMLCAVIVLLLSGLAVPLAGAAAAEPRFDITPFAAYRISGEFRAGSEQVTDPDDGNGWGLSAGLYRDPVSYYELLYSRRSADIGGDDPALRGADVRIEYLHFGGTLLFPQPRGEIGFVSGTLGLTRLEASEPGYDTENKFSVSFGGGVRFPLTSQLHATLGVRGYLTFADSDTGLVCVSDGGQASCLIRSSGSTFWEIEGLAGVSFRF
jgi:opacity protein-like surface antigen